MSGSRYIGQSVCWSVAAEIDWKGHGTTGKVEICFPNLQITCKQPVIHPQKICNQQPSIKSGNFFFTILFLSVPLDASLFEQTYFHVKVADLESPPIWKFKTHATLREKNERVQCQCPISQSAI